MKEDQLSSDIDAINNGFVSISLFDYDLTRNIDLKKKIGILMEHKSGFTFKKMKDQMIKGALR
ncbi:MAG: hypothetical protein CM15mP104_4470 [Gammaproteobacteria bacterium]|nr:MAG: hypothetical protein CM15mP104_4470 [Gammaproteobacteria bacterium]